MDTLQAYERAESMGATAKELWEATPIGKEIGISFRDKARRHVVARRYVVVAKLGPKTGRSCGLKKAWFAIKPIENWTAAL